MYIYSKTIKFILLTLLFIFSINNNSFYTKSIDLNGIKVDLEAEVTKENSIVGSSIDKEKYSSAEYEKDKKEVKDEYVQIELKVKNNNSYEIANITIDEMTPAGFRKIDNTNSNSINFKLEPKTDKKINYSYRYHKSFFNEQYNSILYDEEGNIIDNSSKVEVKNENNKKRKINSKQRVNDLDDEMKDLKKGIFGILKFLLIFVACVILLYVFIMFYKTIKSNDDSFFDKDSSFKCLIIILVTSFVTNIFFYDTTIAKNTYEPQIYEYGKIYEKVVYEQISFNDSLYKFAYKITLTFENDYSIIEEDYEKDTDGDGLIDIFEYQYMTDKENVDTDGDGLSDYIEVMVLDYNPLSEDTYNDGVKDSDRDFDNDKLTNIEEVDFGTDLFNVDTDYDTISDYDEVKIHNTNPLSVDSDKDLLSDPDEIKLGLDPNNEKTDGITFDSERKIEQEYTMTNVSEDLRKGDIFIKHISGKVSGNIDKEVKISKNNNEVFNSMSSFVHSGFLVSLKENETIEIELDVSKVSERKATLVIVKYDNGKFEPIKTICDEDSIKAKLSSGTYTVMDSEIILKDLNIMINDYIP